MKYRAWIAPIMFLTASLLVGCSAARPALTAAVSSAPIGPTTAVSGSAPNTLAVAEASATFPPRREGGLLVYGRDILTKTQVVMKSNVTAGMSCEACHLNAGTKARALSLVGSAARFPQWNKRSKRYIFLQDRLAECFLYSMNGTPPAYNSREMIALAAYVTSLSKGAAIGSEGIPGQELIMFKPDHPSNVNAGQQVYAQRCLACHGANGQGGSTGQFPPLWGPTSFNSGAGMHRLATMAAFVRYDMPYGGPPNVLSKQQAYDVSAYILSRPRPVFDKVRLIEFAPVEADRI